MQSNVHCLPSVSPPLKSRFITLRTRGHEFELVRCNFEIFKKIILTTMLIQVSVTFFLWNLSIVNFHLLFCELLFVFVFVFIAILITCMFVFLFCVLYVPVIVKIGLLCYTASYWVNKMQIRSVIFWQGACLRFFK